MELVDFAKHLARRSGSILMVRLTKMRTIEHKETVSDIVTDADKASEAWLVQEIKTRFPTHRVIAEEGTGTLEEMQQPGYTWVIDPLDGTVNYAHQLPIFAVSIALLRDGVPYLGVVYLPVLDEMFCAIAGQGAMRNNSLIRVSTRDTLQSSVVATGFPYDKHLSERDNIENTARIIKKVHGIRRMGAAAVDLAYVACGRLDGYWEEKLKPWDIAAGFLLVREAGGKITDYSGAPLDLRQDHVIASNSLIHDALAQELRPYAEKHGLLATE